MRLTMYRALAMGGIALSIALGLLVNFLAPAEATVWFGAGMGMIAAATAVAVGFQRHPQVVVVSLAASASSVASGQAGMATMGALGALAIFIAFGDASVPRTTHLRR